MKFIKKLKYMFVLLLVFPTLIFAKENISINCDKTNISLNEEIKCYIKGFSDKQVTAIHSLISADSNVKITNIMALNGWIGENNSKLLELYGKEVLNSFDIASFIISSSIVGNHKITLNNTFFVDENDKENSLDNFELLIAVNDTKSSDNTLKDIKISNTNFKFDSSKTDFSIEVNNDVSEVEITAVKSDDGAIVTGEGKKSLKDGKNEIILNCKAEDGSIKKYTITINRLTEQETKLKEEEEKEKEKQEKEKQSNNNLSKLEIKEYNISFNKSLTTYNIIVENNISNLTIEYEAEEEKSTVEVKGNEDFKVGKNKVEVIVKSEDGKTKTYTINVEKKEAKIVLENNKEEIIEAIGNNENSSTIYINVKENDTNKVVDKEVLSAIEKSNKNVVYQIVNANDDSKILYTVSFNKNNISNLEKFDYSVNFKSTSDESIKKILNDKYISIIFNKQNKSTNKIKFKLNAKELGIDISEVMYLYKYNKEENKLNIVKDNIKIEDGYIIIDTNEFDEYVLTGIDLDKKNDSNKKIVKRSTLIISLILVLIASITVMFIVSEKKKKKNKNEDKITTLDLDKKKENQDKN